MTITTQSPPASRRSLTLSIAVVVAFVVVACDASVSAEVGRPSAPAILLAVPVAAPSASARPTLDDSRPGAARGRAARCHPGRLRPPAPTPRATRPPARKAFAMNLYRRGDFVAQYTNEWCVGASLQMTLNMATAKTRSSRASQLALWKMAQARSFSPFGGANPRGWTAALNDLGIGPYVLVSLPTFEEALQVAAEAIRATKRPVGLVMWRGRHAWVMSGFESIGDPRDPRRHQGHRHPGARPALPQRQHEMGSFAQAECADEARRRWPGSSSAATRATAVSTSACRRDSCWCYRRTPTTGRGAADLRPPGAGAPSRRRR